ncbi:glycoside hydrolase family 5 protein [Halorussus gelatinilyticus]|uniref:Glycoside hydrolase family 5 protein n=1 Tax=Halorussus gelatinilyticus TaxID=2937524 RepID=A0A8U0IFL5_9EURY|nr:cellulase family glycosylhydrolase [Halorussus gelatinilyticus]UPV99772.1 glycoside hydrolase family 5 protein [Halorussus gelatinilyticus]
MDDDGTRERNSDAQQNRDARRDDAIRGGGIPHRDDVTRRDDTLRAVRGAVYLPQKDWNAYQMWANYENETVERELGYAAELRLNSVRVFASYEFWREDGPTFFAHVEHFLTTCRERGIRPVVVLFEAPPESPPTEENLHATDPEKAFGVHSPSRSEVLQPRNWKGYDRSPVHFARRWAQEYAGDDRLLATEIMNEPGDVQPRRDFVTDALETVRDAAPDATLTMGTKDVRFARVYDRDDALDAYQFHMNLPKNRATAREYVGKQRALADEIATEVAGSDASKPLWCTEWQRTLDEPPSRFAPNLASLAPTIREVHDAQTLDGDFFWSLMLRPAYLRKPREKGRVNGLFHDDGAVYSLLDAETVAGQGLDLPRRDSFPTAWRAHRFPYPHDASDVHAHADDSAHPDDAADRDSKSAGLGANGGSDSNADRSAFESDLRDLRDALSDRIRRAFGLDSREDDDE